MAEALEVQIKADAASFNKGVNQAIAGMNRLVAQGKAAGTKLDQISKSTQTLANGMKAFGIGIAAAIGSQVIGSLQQLGAEFIRLAEAPTKFKGSIEALTGSSARAEDMLNRVYAVAKKTGTGFDDTAALIQRLTIGMQALGANNAQIAQLAENVLKLGTISGSSIADTAAAALQLSQALASGKLQGDELRSILERMPKLLEIIAKEMGKPLAEIRKLGSEGKISSDVMANAILKATQQINADFQKMPLTVAQAMNNVRTSIQQAFDNPAAQAAVQALARGVNQIAKAVQAADVYIRNFVSNATRFFTDVGNAIGPVVTKVEELGVSFSGIGGIISSALSGVGNILLAAFIGPIGLIISNWDRVKAYFQHQVPAMFYGLIGAAQDAMATVVSVFQNAWNAVIGIVQNAVNTIIDGINSIAGATNSMIGYDFVPTLDKVDLKTKQLSNTIIGWKDSASRSYGEASAAAQKYDTALRTIARTQAETAATVEAGTTKFEAFNKVLENTAAAADGSGGKGKGGGGGKSGGAAGGIKKAGDAAKKAAEQMDEAKSQVEEFGQAMQQIAQSLGSGVVDALFSIADGSKSAKEAFSELAKSMLKQIANMIVQLLILKPLMGMFGGGFGGLLGGGGLLGRSAALTRDGGRLAVGDYSGFRAANYSGFSGINRSALLSSSPNLKIGQQPMNVTVNNNSSAIVKTRQDQAGLTIDVMEDALAERITRGGSVIDRALSRAYGTRRIGY